MSLTVTIIGLDPLGMSLGLALKRSDYPLTLVAHDREPTLSDEAVKIGAADRREWNLFGAIEGTDLLIINEPFEQFRDTLGLVATDLRADAVVTDTLRLKQPVMALAKTLLPPAVHFVGGTPLVSTSVPNGALFSGRRYALMPAPTAPEAAVRLVTSMVELLGAEPLFMEAAEHDALRAAVEHLPVLSAAALLRLTTGSNGWREMALIADDAFADATTSLAGESVEQVEALYANRDVLLHWLSSYQRELSALAEQLNQASPDALRAHLGTLVEARSRWEAQRVTTTPNDTMAEALDTTRENNKTLARWFGIGRKRS